jgi:hypothetical protein
MAYLFKLLGAAELDAVRPGEKFGLLLKNII